MNGRALNFLDEVITEEFGKVIDSYMAADMDSDDVVNTLLDLRNSIFERIGIDE